MHTSVLFKDQHFLVNNEWEKCRLILQTFEAFVAINGIDAQGGGEGWRPHTLKIIYFSLYPPSPVSLSLEQWERFSRGNTFQHISLYEYASIYVSQQKFCEEINGTINFFYHQYIDFFSFLTNLFADFFKFFKCHIFQEIN